VRNLVYEKELTLDDIIDVYNSNMSGDIIPVNIKNKKYLYIKQLYHTYGYEFVDSIIDICVGYNLKNPFAFFRTVAEDCINRGASSKQKIKDRKKVGRFNNFPQRTYDFDKLERILLGWDE
jgi:hypothetical protein